MQSSEQNSELSSKIQSLSNLVDILDSTTLETIYGLLFVDKGQDTLQLWIKLKERIAEVRLLVRDSTKHDPSYFSR